MAAVPEVPPRTNGLAIASLVSSVLGICCFVGSILGIVFGLVAKGQVEQSAGAQTGRELALAGIVVGVVGLVLSFVWLAFWVFAGFLPMFFMGL